MIHSAEPAQAESYLRPVWPEVAAIADPGKRLYAAFGLGRGRLGQLFGASVWKAGLQAALKGHGIGKPTGDPMMMSGDFLVHDARVAWTSVHEHAGSRSEYAAAVKVAREIDNA